ALAKELARQAGVDKALVAPGGEVVLALSGARAQLWDFATGRPRGKPVDHPRAVSHVVFGADGQFPATSCPGAKVCLDLRVLDLRTGDVIGPAWEVGERAGEKPGRQTYTPHALAPDGVSLVAGHRVLRFQEPVEASIVRRDGAAARELPQPN